MDIFSVLENEHRILLEIMENLEERVKEGGAHLSPLLEETKLEMIAHNRAEQSVFYSKLKAMDFENSLSEVQEGGSQHAELATLLADLESLELGSTEWLSQYSQIKKLMIAHIQHEEQKIHALARQQLTEQEIAQIAKDFQAEKEVVLAELDAGIGRPLAARSASQQGHEATRH